MQYARHRRIVSELGREPVKRFRRIGVCALDLDGDDVVATLKIRLRHQEIDLHRRFAAFRVVLKW